VCESSSDGTNKTLPSFGGEGSARVSGEERAVRRAEPGFEAIALVVVSFRRCKLTVVRSGTETRFQSRRETGVQQRTSVVPFTVKILPNSRRAETFVLFPSS
jgi:hypothetical protein